LFRAAVAPVVKPLAGVTRLGIDAGLKKRKLRMHIMQSRRDFLTMRRRHGAAALAIDGCKPAGPLKLACALVAMATLPAVAAAQSPPAKIGLLAWSGCDVPLFVRGLEELGYEPGKTITIECRSAERSYDGLATAATQLVKLGVDVIVSMSQPAGQAAHDATDTIPIVSIISGDPVAVGLAQSLAKPGGNLTGLSYYANELTLKRLELLKEAVPELATIDVLANPVVSYLPFEGDARQAAAQLGLATRIHHVSEPADLDGTFAAMQAAGAQAVFVLPDMMLASEAPRIASLALEQGLPTMTWGDWYTEAGCLMSYSAQYDELIHRLAYYVDRILKGATPGELPIEQPTTFELSINLHTAKALGIGLPPTLLLRADEVIE
jgi:putative ABC transport system substrate-binding protein